jgi:hypothetical protein
MKKFGTPNGAGPGNANENVGFAAVGTPFFVATAGGFVAGFDVVVVGVEVVPVPWVSLPPGPVVPAGFFVGFLRFPDPVLDGVVEVVGVVEVDVVLVLTVGTGEVLVDGEHSAETLFTGGVPGGRSCDAGVPGAAVTVNTIVWPSSSVAVTVH